MGDLLLGIDIGTSSSKGVLVRPTGEVVARATRPHEMALPRPGWAEHDAESVWWADFTALCAALLPQATSGIAAVCSPSGRARNKCRSKKQRFDHYRPPNQPRWNYEGRGNCRNSGCARRFGAKVTYAHFR